MEPQLDISSTKFLYNRVYIEGRVQSVGEIRAKNTRPKKYCRVCGRVEAQSARTCSENSRCRYDVDVPPAQSADDIKSSDWWYDDVVTVIVQIERDQSGVPRTIELRVRGRPLVQDALKLCSQDLIRASGILRLRYSIQNHRTCEISRCAIPYLDVEHIHQRGTSESIEELQFDDNVDINSAVEIFFPNILGLDDIKRSVILMMAGGLKFNEPATHSYIRSNINVLICGEPGLGKSALLHSVYSLSETMQLVSGCGASAAGFTGALTKVSGQETMLLPGIVARASGGVCIIDEFDKLDESCLKVLLDPMESNTVTITKAGYHGTSFCDTAFLVASNPKKSKWDAKLTVRENINLQCVLLQRFDLIFLVIESDKPEDISSNAHQLIRKPIELSETHKRKRSALYKFIKDVVAKREITIGCKDYLSEAYVGIRRSALIETDRRRRGLPASPRTLISLIRISAAHAKLRSSTEIERVDVEEAVRLINRVRIRALPS